MSVTVRAGTRNSQLSGLSGRHGATMTVSRVPGLAPLIGLVVTGTLLASCAGLGQAPPGSRAGAPAGQSESAKLEEERQQLQRERQKLEQERQRFRQERQKPEQAYRTLEQSHQRLTQEYQKLDEAAKKQAAANHDLEEQLARLHMSLLEREAQVKLLTQKLDAAILEVVRAMAKLRSLESRAEAASHLAETEIALNVVERESAGREKLGDAVQAEKLLAVAGQEFQKQNYGGALYLTTQAKGLLKSGPGVRGGGTETLPKVDGEVPFSLPLPLRVLSRGSVREGPGHNFQVSFAVAEGAPVTGHSYKGMWVRVRNDDGRLGWIFYNLVGQR
jgi:Bacterial SH3 domain